MTNLHSVVLTAAAVATGFAGAALAQVALPETVEVAPLAKDAFSTGLINPAEGGLKSDLWRRADPEVLHYLLAQAPARPASPSIGEAMRRVLLSSGDAPTGASADLGGRKLVALARAGFLDETVSIASLSINQSGNALIGQGEAIVDLAKNDTAAACRRSASLGDGRRDEFWVKLRAFCYALAGERDAADLTFNVLREGGSLSLDDEAFLGAAITGTQLKTVRPVIDVLHLAIARRNNIAIMPDFLTEATGAVLAGIAEDPQADIGLRIVAVEQLVARGVYDVGALRGVFETAQFELEEIAGAAELARENPTSPIVDALLYRSVQQMAAPEFVRDKAQRVALALSATSSFARSFALANLYEQEIASLEGVVVAPSEAAAFARARMLVGDSIGAAQWLRAMLGASASINALPEALALEFIDLVGDLSILDPQTASMVARSANVATLPGAGAAYAQPASGNAADHAEAAAARILDAAFDAAAGDKPGQAALAAIAASSAVSSDPAIQSVIVTNMLSAAGLAELSRRYLFETSVHDRYNAGAPAQAPANDGVAPRLKPGKTN